LILVTVLHFTVSYMLLTKIRYQKMENKYGKVTVTIYIMQAIIFLI